MIGVYDNSIEYAIKNGWNFEKIIKVKGKKIRYFILRREETEYLEQLKIIAPKDAEELEVKELYCKFRTINGHYYEEVMKTLEKLGEKVKEIESEPLNHKDTTLEKLINM